MIKPRRIKVISQAPDGTLTVHKGWQLVKTLTKREQTRRRNLKPKESK